MSRHGRLLHVTLALLFAAAAPATEPVTLTALGDLMPARAMTDRIKQQGAGWVWEKVIERLAETDLRFVNFESAATTRGESRGRPFSFRVSPTLAREVLAAGGFDFVSLANNHAWDYGPVGLADSLKALRPFGLAGAGSDRAAAVVPVVRLCRGLRVGLVAYTAWTTAGYRDQGPVLATIDESSLPKELAAARVACDLLLVSVHWGIEYERTPSAAQRRLARLAIDHGADVVLGHGPHVAQPIEWYRDRLIAYSLGNAVFDRDDPRYSNGLLLQLRLTPGDVELVRKLPLILRQGRPTI